MAKQSYASRREVQATRVSMREMRNSLAQSNPSVRGSNPSVRGSNPSEEEVFERMNLPVSTLQASQETIEKEKGIPDECSDFVANST